MVVIILLLISVGLAAIIVWLADWTSDAPRYTALAALNRRLANGEIDRAEYDEEKRKQSDVRSGRRRRKSKRQRNNPADA